MVRIREVFALRPGPLALALSLCVACSSGGGGGKKGGAPDDKAAEKKSGDSTDTSTDTGGAPSDTGGDSADTGGDTGEVSSGGALTDDAICKVINAHPAAAKMKAEIAYLCDQGGLKKLRASPNGKMTPIVDKQQNGLSYFTFAAAIKAKGTIAGAAKIDKAFCTDFNQYKSLLGDAAFKDVESFTPSNKVANGCDYLFKGKTVVLFQPRFKGQIRTTVNKEGTIGVSGSYLIQADSLVQNSVTLNVVVKDGTAGVINYSVLSNVSDTKGFHTQAREGIIAGNEAGMQGFVSALSKVGS